ncbi:MAG: dTMP kinase [Bryobacteraceae bacterium]
MTEMPRGLFITFEGTDGSGKTTQIGMFLARLRAAGYDAVQTAEPGGTVIGNQIRKILLDPANVELAPRAEMLLYFASRAQNVAEVIRPSIAAGRIVVCDRFTDSTLAYQGAGRGLGEETVLALHEVACGELQPDLTFFLDIDLKTGLERARRRNENEGTHDQSRMDEQSIEFHRQVRDAYLRLAASHPERFRVVDASLDPEGVHAAIWRHTEAALESRVHA